MFARTKDKASSLASHKRTKIVDVHHRSLSSFKRRDVEKEFRVRERRIVIATIGFGMVFKVIKCDVFALRRMTFRALILATSDSSFILASVAQLFQVIKYAYPT